MSNCTAVLLTQPDCNISPSQSKWDTCCDNMSEPLPGTYDALTAIFHLSLASFSIEIVALLLGTIFWCCLKKKKAALVIICSSLVTSVALDWSIVVMILGGKTKNIINTLLTNDCFDRHSTLVLKDIEGNLTQALVLGFLEGIIDVMEIFLDYFGMSKHKNDDEIDDGASNKGFEVIAYFGLFGVDLILAGVNFFFFILPAYNDYGSILNNMNQHSCLIDPEYNYSFTANITYIQIMWGATGGSLVLVSIIIGCLANDREKLKESIKSCCQGICCESCMDSDGCLSFAKCFPVIFAPLIIGIDIVAIIFSQINTIQCSIENNLSRTLLIMGCIGLSFFVVIFIPMIFGRRFKRVFTLLNIILLWFAGYTMYAYFSLETHCEHSSKGVIVLIWSVNKIVVGLFSFVFICRKHHKDEFYDGMSGSNCECCECDSCDCDCDCCDFDNDCCHELFSWGACFGLCMIALVLTHEICTMVYPLNMADDNACHGQGDIFPIGSFVFMLGLTGLSVVVIMMFAACCCEGAMGKLAAFGLLAWFILSILAYIEYFKLTAECKKESVAKLCLAWAIIKTVNMCCAAISVFSS